MSQHSVTFVTKFVDWLNTLSQLYSLQISERERHDDNEEEKWKQLLKYFKGPKTHKPLARGTEKDHFMSVQIMPVLCKILTELCTIMVSLNKGRDKLHETRILTNTVLIRNIFSCCRLEVVIVVSRLWSFGSCKRVILKTSTNFSEWRNSSFFYPEDKGSKFLRNVCTSLPDYVRPHTCFMRRQSLCFDWWILNKNKGSNSSNHCAMWSHAAITSQVRTAARNTLLLYIS